MEESPGKKCFWRKNLEIIFGKKSEFYQVLGKKWRWK